MVSSRKGTRISLSWIWRRQQERRRRRIKLPNSENDIADVRKLRGYCLNPEHPQGRHKARVFSATLDLGAADAEELREALLCTAHSAEAFVEDADEYGQRYVPDFGVSKAAGHATVRSGWIVRRGGRLPEVHELLSALGE